jgi:hypothetical protein
MNKIVECDIDNLAVSQTAKPAQELNYYRDPRIIVPLKGHNYKFRMLFFKDEASTRTSPFIVKYVHTAYYKADDGLMHSEIVTCPSTDWVKHPNPFGACKACTASLFAWKQKEKTPTEALESLYKSARRKFVALIPVVVLEDSQNPDNYAKVRILAISHPKEYSALSTLIDTDYAAEKKKLFNNVGSDDAYNLVVNATGKKSTRGDWEYRNIEFSFEKATKPLSKNFDEAARTAFYEKHIFPLKFDADFYTPYSQENSNALYTKYIEPKYNAILKPQTEIRSEMTNTPEAIKPITFSPPAKTMTISNKPTETVTKILHTPTPPSDSTAKQVEDLLAEIQRFNKG